jgi:hypothetical protein
MKKLLLSAIAMIAFTATSFASQISSAEIKMQNVNFQELSLLTVDEALQDDGCVTTRHSVITFLEVCETVNGFEVFISYALYDITVCDDGSNSSFTMKKV